MVRFLVELRMLGVPKWVCEVHLEFVQYLSAKAAFVGHMV